MDYTFKKHIVEALIFAADSPLSETKIIHYVEELDAKTLRKIIDELLVEYQQQQRPFTLQRLGGGYQIVTRPEFAPWIRKMLRSKVKTRLSQAALEVLSIIAFKQPISRPQIEAIRGTNCDGIVKNLLDRNVIAVAGRADAIGRPIIFKTTDDFLCYFGINSLDDLPKPKEVTELVGDQDELVDSLQLSDGTLGQRDLFAALISDRENAKIAAEEADGAEVIESEVTDTETADDKMDTIGETADGSGDDSDTQGEIPAEEIPVDGNISAEAEKENDADK